VLAFYINTVVRSDNRRTPTTADSWAAPLSLSLAQVVALVRVRVTVSLAAELVPVADSVRAYFVLTVVARAVLPTEITPVLAATVNDAELVPSIK